MRQAAGPDENTQREIQLLSDRIQTLRKEMSSSHFKAWEKTNWRGIRSVPTCSTTLIASSLTGARFTATAAMRDDPAIIGGMARFHGEEVMIVGHQKARDTKQKVYRNFGMPNPEGYRKAMRVMKIAEKFGRPLLTFVDTPGAYPGLGAEERGQAEAIAHNLREMARLQIPIITTITGEGGSGGALAIAVADRVLMMENSIYSVISPEGCASIMWRDPSKKELAAEAMRITARRLAGTGLHRWHRSRTRRRSPRRPRSCRGVARWRVTKTSLGPEEKFGQRVDRHPLREIPQHGTIFYRRRIEANANCRVARPDVEYLSQTAESPGSALPPARSVHPCMACAWVLTLSLSCLC